MAAPAAAPAAAVVAEGAGLRQSIAGDRIRPEGSTGSVHSDFPGKDNAAISVTAVKLAGIVGGRGGLMALVEGPDGTGYILKPGDALGDGRVTGITPNSVTFAGMRLVGRAKPTSFDAASSGKPVAMKGDRSG